MGRKSTIAMLPQTIREEVDRLIRSGNYTIDDILAHLKSLGGEASRSAVGRYVQKAEAQMERFRQAQEVAKVWVAKLEEEPDGDVARLLPEMLRTVAFSVMGELHDKDGKVKPMDVMLLAKAIKDLASADKAVVDRVLKMREEINRQVKAAEQNVKKIVTKAGLDKETAAAIRKQILGIGQDG